MLNLFAIRSIESLLASLEPRTNPSSPPCYTAHVGVVSLSSDVRAVVVEFVCLGSSAGEETSVCTRVPMGGLLLEFVLCDGCAFRSHCVVLRLLPRCIFLFGYRGVTHVFSHAAAATNAGTSKFKVHPLHGASLIPSQSILITSSTRRLKNS